MRCLSPHARYSIQVEAGVEQVMMDARGHAFTQIVSKPHIANFERQGLLDNEIDVALDRFNFSGVPDGVNVLTKIGVFDTEAYAQQFPEGERQATLERLDVRLRELQKLFPNEFIIIDTPAKPKPWPNYDEMDLDEIFATQAASGISPESVRLYELENKNRPEVIQAMMRLEDPEGAELLYGPVEEDIVVQA